MRKAITDLELTLSRNVRNGVGASNYDLKEGGGFEDIHRAGNLRFDKRPLRRLPFLRAISFVLLRNQSTLLLSRCDILHGLSVFFPVFNRKTKRL
jgi:hypothetical protein